MANISVDQLAAEIAKGLAEYSQEVVEKVNVSSDKVGKSAVKRLKETSPKDSGDYAKSWRVKTDPQVGQPNTLTIHNKDHYYLTHLLEHGHAKANGGRVAGIPHIRPAEEMVIEQFIREVEGAIKMDEATLFTLLKTINLPVAYHHFTSPPSPPYMVYLFSYNTNFGADNKVYAAAKNFQVELYTKTKDPASEALIEGLFDANDIFWEKTETYIDSEDLYQILYEI